MENKERLLENYAELILKRGVGLRAGQILVVEETSVTAIEFLRILAKKAYELGAKDVVIHFTDQQLTKIPEQRRAGRTARRRRCKTRNMEECYIGDFEGFELPEKGQPCEVECFRNPGRRMGNESFPG